MNLQPEKFWAKVDKSGDCWLWTGKKDKDGYGIAQRDGKEIKAHRLSWLITHGQLNPQLCVRHNCDNPPCVRPDHLIEGTKQANSKDMSDRNRSGPQKYPERYPRGNTHPNSRLTDSVVLEIDRRCRSGESHNAIANELQIDRRQIDRIASHSVWQHLWDNP